MHHYNVNEAAIETKETIKALKELLAAGMNCLYLFLNLY